MFAKTGRGRRHDAPVWRNSNFVGGHSICPRCMEFHSNTRRRTPEPALCKGRCRAERGTGVVPYTNYLSFLQTFSFYNPSGALAPAPVDAKRQRRREPQMRLSHPQVAGAYPLTATRKLVCRTFSHKILSTFKKTIYFLQKMCYNNLASKKTHWLAGRRYIL